jgi:hypothetical protein
MTQTDNGFDICSVVSFADVRECWGIGEQRQLPFDIDPGGDCFDHTSHDLRDLMWLHFLSFAKEI